MKLKRVSINDRFGQWVTYTAPKSARLSGIYDAIQDDETADFEEYAIVFGGSRGEYEDSPNEFYVYNISDIFREVVDACGGMKNFVKNYVPRVELMAALREMGIEVMEDEE
jgi:hypothetical protein